MKNSTNRYSLEINLTHSDIDAITEALTLLGCISKKREELLNLEKKIPQPLVTDFSKMQEIYRIYLNQIDKIPDTLEIKKDYKKIFILIIYMICAPEVLSGVKSPSGLRKQISETINSSGGFISHNVPVVLSHYFNYASERHIIAYLYGEIRNWLTTNGETT